MTAPLRLSLSGADWRLKDYIGEDWLGRRAHHADTRDTRHWRPATVPGTVQHDLWQAGEIPNPYVGRNSLLCEWAPQRTWVYRKSFHVDETWRGRHLRLRFAGVDYAARFFLNGQALGAHEGLFEPVVFDITEKVQYGAENLVAVVIDPAPHEQPQIGYTSRVRTFKPRMNYWWDFCPRLIHLGIWDEVTLEATGPARVEGLHIRPQLSGDFKRAEVECAATLWAAEPLRAMVTTTLRYAGEEVASHCAMLDLKIGQNAASVALTVEDPHLWWPNGYGEPALYQAEVRVEAPGGAWHAAEANAGLRTLAFEPNEPTHPGARPYKLVVNGRPIYLNGWNWVPMDVMYGVERPAKRQRLLSLAQRAHVNLLRVWGGGLIEKEAFYDECDRRGLLVWQEFIQSSSGVDNVPPETPEYIAALTALARVVIPRRRNHPSLAIWCGGNELQAERPLDETHPALGALHTVVQELDPDRLWLPTSSTGPVFENSLHNIERDPHSLHDVHGPWEHQGLTTQYTLYNTTTSLLHSEFGVEGLTNARALACVLPNQQDREPVSLDNPYWHHLGAWWVKERRWREMLGDWRSVDELLRATQFLQADGLRYAAEANRRRQWQNSGTLPWQFNEPFPMAACTSAVDYFAEPKPLYHAVRRAYAPLTVTARFSRQAWAGEAEFAADLFASSSGAGLAGATLTAEVRDAGGRTVARLTDTVDLAANATTPLGSLRADLAAMGSDVFALDLRLEAGGDRAANRYLFSRTENIRPLLNLAPTALHVAAAYDGDCWTLTLTNAGPLLAVGLWIEDPRPHPAEGYVYIADNHFHLFPGETRTLTAEWDGVPAGERALSVAGWNTPPVRCCP